VPENRVEKLLPVWPVAPLNEFRAAAARKSRPADESGKEGPGSRRHNPAEKDVSKESDEDGHLDLYA